ncbi:hypothetical protein CHS0354_012800 [Potamilus streckersoni]|uniref:Uncharacterized protein n=1 Tax=Potamilus streckersoni TaxID=2493646 RepID=A0AAE0SW39_9BIVA|nr:hypothetical protein CHS0354_012800 [Potamilus streckersoni]
MDLKKRTPKASIAMMVQLWMRILPLFISGIETGNSQYQLEVDILDAVAGQTFLVKTWADNHQLKSITVSRDNVIRFTAFFVKADLKISRDKQGVIFLENNNATRKMSLILQNFTRVDEGKYNVEEIEAANTSKPFEKKSVNWNFKLNVIGMLDITYAKY